VNIKELQKRLRKIGAVDKNGAAISERTLRDWAAKGLITGPEAAPRKTLKRVGRPPNKSGKGAGKIESGEPGRFYDWPEKSYEEAAAVWSIRQLSHGLEEKFKKDNEAILELRHEAERFYDNSLHPDTLSFWIWFKTPLEFGTKITPPLVSWVAAVEKARKNEQLDTPVKVVFRWLSQKHDFTIIEEPSGERSVLLVRLKEGDTLDSIEIYVCYSEEPVTGYRAYRPGRVIASVATEAGSQLSRTYRYFPPSEFIALTVPEKGGSTSLRAFGHYPTHGERRRKNGFLLEWTDSKDLDDG
jgi:hypothetical protein